MHKSGAYKIQRPERRGREGQREGEIKRKREGKRKGEKKRGKIC